MKRFRGKTDGFTILPGDNGWIKEHGEMVHRVITYSKKDGIKEYKNGKLITKKKWWEFWK